VENSGDLPGQCGYRKIPFARGGGPFQHGNGLVRFFLLFWDRWTGWVEDKTAVHVFEAQSRINRRYFAQCLLGLFLEVLWIGVVTTELALELLPGDPLGDALLVNTKGPMDRPSVEVQR